MMTNERQFTRDELVILRDCVVFARTSLPNKLDFMLLRDLHIKVDCLLADFDRSHPDHVDLCHHTQIKTTNPYN